MPKNEYIQCPQCKSEFNKTDLKRNCCNCFACTGCEVYICYQCGERIELKAPRPYKSPSSKSEKNNNDIRNPN